MIEDIVKDLIQFKTVYPNYLEIDKCIEYIKNYYINKKVFIKTFSHKKDKSIFISNTKSKNLDVLFVGHIDVVQGDDSQFIPIVKNNLIYGRGSFDMKGHVAVMMKLLKYNDFKIKVGLLLISDEERGGFNGTNIFLNKLHYSSKIAIIPDAGNNFEIIDEEKGVLQIKVSYKGKKSHSSKPWEGNNSIKRIFELYNYLLKKYPLPISSKDYKTSINIAKIVGGNETNVVAEDCYAILDIRHTVKDTKEKILKDINNFDKKIKIEVLAKGEPFITIKNKFYKQFLVSYEKVLKKRPKYSKCESASDGRLFCKNNIPCVLMNAKGANMHSKNEYINIKSLEKLYTIYLDYLNNFISID